MNSIERKKKFDLCKSKRLRKRKEYLLIKRNGHSFANNFFIIGYIQKKTDGRKLGITVPKFVGNAVKRNFLKRNIREAFRLNQYIISDGTDLNVICKKASSNLNSKEIQKSIANLLLKKWQKGSYLKFSQ